LQSHYPQKTVYLVVIARIEGTLLETRPAAVVVMVGGIGYLVHVKAGEPFVAGADVTLYTHLAIRETAHDLYGFRTPAERDFFELLIKLPKIGPKTALQIMTQADLPTLVKAIGDNDPTYLSKMSGLGRKTAEKIVSELKDTPLAFAYTGTELPTHTGESDVLDALLALGYSQKDARDAVAKIPADLTDTQARLRAALRHIH
jgi:Holliday junction DNA helicase RuvA